MAGLRARRLAFNAETVDITDAASAGRWRELLGGAGVQRASLSGSGIFKDASRDATFRTLFFAERSRPIRPSFPIRNRQLVPSRSRRSKCREHNGEVTFEVSLESAGLLTFAVA